ncbi:MAG: YbaN family protein [Dehalococcoidales bacterium]|nr:YbaN family protein [Dehalococcoidales bacterium]
MSIQPKDKLKKRLFIAGGTVSLTLGIIGIILPVLPTTPFLLLAAFCYIRGSQRLHSILLNNRFIGRYISNYLEGKGMSAKMKIWTLILLWVSLLLTIFLFTDILWIKITLAVILAGVTIHILLIKTAKNNSG